MNMTWHGIPMFYIEISVSPVRCHVDVLLLRIILYKHYHADHPSNTFAVENCNLRFKF